MAKQPPTSRRAPVGPAPADAPPQSHLRIRPPAERRDPVDELADRVDAGELSIEAAIEQMRAMSLDTARSELPAGAVDVLEQVLRDMPLPHVAELRRRRG